MTDIPALIRLPHLLVRVGLFGAYQDAERQIKKGNIYVEVGDDPARTYWLRMDEVDGYVCIPTQTRIKHITAEGAVIIKDIRPHAGRDKHEGV